MTGADVPVTVIVLSWQGAHLLPDCLAALADQDHPDFDVLVVDNASTDGTAELVRRSGVRLLANPTNLGYAGGNNAALASLASPVAVVLNNDARPAPGWLRALVGPLADPLVGAVTSLVLLAEDGHVNNTGAVVFTDGYGADRGFGDPASSWNRPGEVFGFSGTAVALRRAALDDVGLFDDDFFLYYEDTDLSWRLRSAGWTVAYAPDAVVHHLHAATTDQASPLFAFYNERNRLLALTKNATAGRTLLAVLRFPVTTASIALRGLRRGHLDPRVGVRTRAFASYLRLLPGMLRKRRALGRRAVVSRAALERRWLVPVSRRRPDGTVG